MNQNINWLTSLLKYFKQTFPRYSGSLMIILAVSVIISSYLIHSFLSFCGIVFGALVTVTFSFGITLLSRTLIYKIERKYKESEKIKKFLEILPFISKEQIQILKDLNKAPRELKNPIGVIQGLSSPGYIEIIHSNGGDCIYAISPLYISTVRKHFSDSK